MDKKGSIITRVFTSKAQLPIENASVTVYRDNGSGGSEVIAQRTTNSSGRTTPVVVDTPAIELSQNPGNINPFTIVNIRVSHPEFYNIVINDVQVFSDTITIQNADMIPIEETNSKHDRTETVNVTPQNL